MDRFMKKFVQLSLLFVLVISTLLAGCSSNTKTEKSSGTAEKPKTITLWYGVPGTSEEALKEVVKQFEKKNPNIKVNEVYVADMMAGGGSKLLAAIAGGTPPDVVYFDRFQIGSWAAKGSLTDLTEKIKASGISSDKFYKFAWEESTYKNKQYGLPTNVDARMLFYNKDHFKEAGLNPNSPPKTIKELEAAAEKLTVKKGSHFDRIGFIPWLDQGFLYTWGWVFGGNYYNQKTGKVTANDPQVVEALQWFVDYSKKYNMNQIASFTDSAGKEQMAPFLTGQLSMQVSGNEMIAKIKKYKPDLNFGVAPIPTPTGSNFTTWSGGWSFVIPKGAKQVDPAWGFIKFASGEEGQTTINRIAGTIAVTPSVNDKLGYKNDPVLKQFIELLPISHNRPVISQGQLMWNEFKNVSDLAIHEKGTPKQLLDDLTNKVNSELQKDAAKK